MKADKPKTKKRFSRPVKVVFALTGALLLYTVVGFLVAPAIIKAQMLKRLPPLLGRPVAVAQVKVNPYSLSLTIRGLAVNETNGAPFAGFDEFFAELKWGSFFRHGWTVREIYLTHPFAGLVRGRDGQLNFDDIIAALNKSASPPSTNTAKSALPIVIIDSLHIDNADVAIDDFVPATPVKSKILPIHLHLDNLSTEPKAHNPWTFTAQTDAGETIKWEGIFSLDPVEVSGTIELKNLALKKYSPYLAQFANAAVVDGQVDVNAHYAATLGTNGPDVTLDKTDVALRSLVLKATAPDETVLSVSNLSVKLADASLHKQVIHLASMKTDTGALVVRQNADHTINLLQLLKPQTNSAPAPAAPATNALPWTLMVDEISVDHYHVAAEDHVPARPALFDLKDITFHATNFSTVSNAPLAVEIGLGLNDTGKIAVRGSVRLQPPSADLVLDLSGLDLRSAQPYLEQQTKLTVRGGSFALHGHATYDPQASPQVGFDGGFGVDLNDAGKVDVRGSVRLQPISADLALDVVGLDLRPIQPYLEQQVKLSLGGGVFTLHGHASYNPLATPQAAFAGDLGLTNFATTDLIQYKDFVKFDGLAVNGIKFAYLPMSVGVQEIGLSGLNTTVIMQTNRQINLLAVLPPKPAGTPVAPPPAASSGVDFPVTLGSLVIDKASVHFSDQSIEPNCLFDVQEFGGSIKGLSSDQAARAAVDIHGKVDDVSTFSVMGEVNPLSKELVVNLAVDCKNVNLTPFTPYLEKYGGYPLQRGKLLLDLHNNIAHGMLNASNHFVLGSLTLGPRNTSTNATKLPLRFGIALLKDRFGNIDFDVPLSGRLNDPDFKIWPVVWQVVGQLIERAATAPFTFLGKLVGGGEEMKFVDFPAGLSDIPPAEQTKLDKVAKILFERPGLQLEISATSDPVSDIPVLTHLKLDGQIRSLQAKELIAAGTPPETVQAMTVEPTNYARLLKALYWQTIGTNVSTNTSTNVIVALTNMTGTDPGQMARVSTNIPVAAHTSTNNLQLFLSAYRNSKFPIFIKGGERMVLNSTPGNLLSDLSFKPVATPGGTNRVGVPAPATAESAVPPTPKAGATATAPPFPNSSSTNVVAVESGGTNTVDLAPVPPEPTQEEMTTALLATIHVNADDLRALMQARARSVQASLVNKGKVVGERLFILAPAPVSLDAKGQARASLAFPQ